MGFLDRLEKSVDDFFDFSPSAYRSEICNLKEDELREEHKQIQRKLASAGAQIAAGGVAAGATAGLSLLALSGVGARRVRVNQQKCDIIGARLRQEGWRGHEFGLKDVVIGAGPSAVTSVFAPGAEHLVGPALSHATSHVAAHSAAHVTTTTVSHAVAHTTSSTAIHTVTHGAAHGAHHAAAVHTGTHSTMTGLENKAVDSGTKHAIQSGTDWALKKILDAPETAGVLVDVASSGANTIWSTEKVSTGPSADEVQCHWSEAHWQPMSLVLSSVKAETPSLGQETMTDNGSWDEPDYVAAGRRKAVWKLILTTLNLGICTLLGGTAFYFLGPLGLALSLSGVIGE